jgi:hypothetical protein
MVAEISQCFLGDKCQSKDKAIFSPNFRRSMRETGFTCLKVIAKLQSNRLSGNHETEPALTELNTVVVKRLPSVFQTVKPSFTHRSEGIWQKDYLTFGFAYLA